MSTNLYDMLCKARQANTKTHLGRVEIILQADRAIMIHRKPDPLTALTDATSLRSQHVSEIPILHIRKIEERLPTRPVSSSSHA